MRLQTKPLTQWTTYGLSDISHQLIINMFFLTLKDIIGGLPAPIQTQPVHPVFFISSCPQYLHLNEASYQNNMDFL